jgi:hypothetical protein
MRETRSSYRPLTLPLSPATGEREDNTLATRLSSF